MDNSSSYTAASSIPSKVVQDQDLLASVRSGFVPLRHLQFIPTNRCNLSCSFCSCSERDKKQEMLLSVALELMHKLPSLGCRSVTITGGGEPLLHGDINVMIHNFAALGIKVGLVTNGTKFGNLLVYDDITWCRISISDDRELNFDDVRCAVQSGPSVDWAFSYVLTGKPNWRNLAATVAFANAYGFTHVRLVGDILDHDCSASLVDEARGRLEYLGVNDHLVIYQPRANFTKGRQSCLISLLKPVVGPDGGIYPCCGVQYASDPPSRDLDDTMRMGSIADLEAIWRSRQAFDGSVCFRCYYDNYNLLLDMMSSKLAHVEFV